MKTLKELTIVFSFMIVTVVASSYEWSFGVAVIGILAIVGMWRMLFRAEDKMERRINMRCATPAPRNLHRDNARFASRMEEKICENGEF